jgi:hypothetical protein
MTHEWVVVLGPVGHESKEDRLSHYGLVPDAVNIVNHLRRVSPESGLESTRVASSRFT